MNKKLFVSGALALATAIGVAGGSMLNTTQTFAADPTPTTTQTQQAQPFGSSQGKPTDQNVDPTKGGHVGKNGVKEELLSGDVADKVKAAALAAQPGSTIERVETDAEGAAYEAHIKKSDGTRVTLKFDTNYNVTATETGPMK